MCVQLPFLLRAVILTDAFNEIDRLAVVNEEISFGFTFGCVNSYSWCSQKRSFPIKLLSRRGSADAR